jgi:hypothetical protein
VWATVTREKLTAAVLAAIWSGDYESKLMNDYNAAKIGRLDSSYIRKYEDFIRQRKAIKGQVEKDYRAIFNIVRSLKDAVGEKVADVEDYDVSDSVNNFLVNNIPCWIDKDNRAVYRGIIETAKSKGVSSISLQLGSMIIPQLPVILAEATLNDIEYYAYQAAMVTAYHKDAISKLTTIEEVDGYDFTAGYPEKVTLEIPMP